LKTDRTRYDDLTARLLNLEQQVQELLLGSASHELITQCLDAVWKQIEELPAILTSKELDQLLQLVMMYVTAHLAFQQKDRGGQPFQSTISIYYQRGNDRTVLVKPCFYGPGRCSIQHPTISIIESREGKLGIAGRIGHTGMSLLHGEVLYCAKPGKDSCGQYIQLQRQSGESPSRSALCIPLTPDLGKVIARFLKSAAQGCQVGCETCVCTKEAVRELARKTTLVDSLAVLNLESQNGDLTPERAAEILQDQKIRAALEKVASGLDGYRRDRGKYKALRTCTSLFELSQHNLSTRDTYRALLQAISQICDGADVTLHLLDMRKLEDESRCIKLVAGVGPNFRGFLVNERYGLGDGMIGTALQNEKTDFIVQDEIDQAMEGEGKPFKQLMPRAVLNMTTTLAFHDLHFGVLNIEWDEHCMEGKDPRSYAQEVQPLIERLASYLATVVDYYEDRAHADLGPEDKKERETSVRREIVRRQMMDYHVGGVMEEVDRLPSSGVAESEKARFKKVIDAVGYLIRFDNDLRIMVSLRKLTKNGGEASLEHLVDHGARRDEIHPLALEVGESVLGTCAALGVPLFGQVLDRKFLQIDPKCLKLLRKDKEGALLNGKIVRYVPCGLPEPVYEIALPLIFGNKVLGTLDFELFSPTEVGQSKPGMLERFREVFELRELLDWARAISFCLAYKEDRESWVGLSPEKRESLSCFQRLCALVIANVRIPEEQADAIAEDYFRELVTFGHAEVQRRVPNPLPVSSATPELPEERRPTVLSFRGRPLGLMRLWPPENGIRHGYTLFPDHNTEGPGGRVSKLMAAYYTSTLLAPQPPKGARDLGEILGRVRKSLEGERWKVFSDPQLHAGQVIENLFESLAGALTAELGSFEESKGAVRGARYAWFLYLARYSDATRTSELRCGAPLARWATADTEDMNRCLERIRQHPQENLLEMVRQSGQEEEVAKVLFERCRDGGFDSSTLRHVLTEMLSWKSYPWRYDDSLAYVGKGEEDRSFTRHVAESQEVQISIDFQMSPHRSPRDSRWFYLAPYSIIGMPVTLGGRTIAVLNLFRRRDNREDFLFFDNEEMEEVEEFRRFLEKEVLEKLVDVRKMPGNRQDLPLKDLLPRKRLAQELREALKTESERVVTVECYFASDRDAVHSVATEAIPSGAYKFEWNWPDLESGLLAKEVPPVTILSVSTLGKSESFRERLWLAVQKSQRLILFCEPGARIEAVSYLPEVVDTLPIEYKESKEEIEDYLLASISKALRRSLGPSQRAAVLFRRGDVLPGDVREGWTIEDLARELGSTIGLIRIAAADAPRYQLMRPTGSWKGFADWVIYSSRSPLRAGQMP
jgi:hypothetical protein